MAVKSTREGGQQMLNVDVVKGDWELSCVVHAPNRSPILPPPSIPPAT